MGKKLEKKEPVLPPEIDFGLKQQQARELSVLSGLMIPETPPKES